MEDGLNFFFDSYALIEIFENNPRYEKYVQINAFTSYFHVYEVYYSLLRAGYTLAVIEDFFEMIQTLCVDLDFSWIPLAVQFKKLHAKQNLSYADCIGYVAAKQLGMKFLTGDKEFKALSNVEFVTR